MTRERPRCTPIIVVMISLLAYACGEDREPKDPFVVDETNASSNNDAIDMGVSDEEDAGETDGGQETEPPTCEGQLCELTCEVLANPDFCWNVGFREAYACTEGADVGTIPSGGNVCNAPVDGMIDEYVSIAFAEPLSLGDPADREVWDFNIQRGNVDCMSFVDSETGFELAAESGETVIEYDGINMVYSITCPDDVVWQTTDVEGIFGCQDNDGISTLPGTVVTEIGARFDYRLLPAPMALFSCEIVD